ncbi:MAG TPA: molybdopterin-guanine dinucleotide biosynthesis protein B [Clostridia bacterium]|nr:molybdopterin-guanine dinucleotide biosynthesis protein B [Clostridia bacterium]
MVNNKFPATGVVLAGGESKRMGADKALIKIGDCELINSVILEMQKIVSETFVVCAPEKKRRLPGGKIISDIYTGCGPLGGIHAALVNSAYPYCLVAACDMPFFDAVLGTYLLGCADGYDAVVPVVNAFPEPLFAVYGQGCIEVAEQRLLDRKYKITDMYADLKVNYIDENSLRGIGNVDEAFFNVNTYEDLKEAKKIKEGYSRIPVVAIAGWSKSGKTTLLEKLIPELKGKGIRVAVVKHHSRPGLEFDKKGKDTWKFARSGADMVVLAAPGATVTYNYDFGDPTLEDALYHIKGVDIILVEGYKRTSTEKIEILSEGRLSVASENDLVAVVGDAKSYGGNDLLVPVFSCDDVSGLANFIEARYLKGE